MKRENIAAIEGYYRAWKTDLASQPPPTQARIATHFVRPVLSIGVLDLLNNKACQGVQALMEAGPHISEHIERVHYHALMGAADTDLFSLTRDIAECLPYGSTKHMAHNETVLAWAVSDYDRAPTQVQPASTTELALGCRSQVFADLLAVNPPLLYILVLQFNSAVVGEFLEKIAYT